MQIFLGRILSSTIGPFWGEQQIKDRYKSIGCFEHLPQLKKSFVWSLLPNSKIVSFLFVIFVFCFFRKKYRLRQIHCCLRGKCFECFSPLRLYSLIYSTLFFFTYLPHLSLSLSPPPLIFYFGLSVLLSIFLFYLFGLKILLCTAMGEGLSCLTCQSEH